MGRASGAGGWRSGRRGGAHGSGARWLALAVIAAALVGAGYGWGRWTKSDSARHSHPDGFDRPPTAADSGARGDLEAPVGSPRASGAPSRGSLAIVIDDLGRSLEVIDQLRAFGVPLTYAVLPFEPRSAEVAIRLAELGEEVLCHLPMEAHRGEDPGPGALDAGMRPRALRASTRRALDAVPGAAGVNNHMGSALSEDRVAMEAVLEVVRARGMFFLDSRTSPQSVGFSLARDLGMAAGERKVFLDGDRDPEAIRRELHRLLALADGGAPAIAIGHPYPETLAVLAEEIPRARSAGYRFVRVSEAIASE
ncbi:MAG TPA: divergent polysaccharide deacetylase family protein [Thermoanaerobaculia bacterium]|nr:divergent polysaccharide deacetylase family protein [Thermoanaerobaculia bacterium]